MTRARMWMAMLAVPALVACGNANAPGPHQPGRVSGAVDVGPEARDVELDLVLSFGLRDADRIDSHRYTPAEFGARHGARPSDYDDVARALESAGFTIVRRAEARTTLTVRAPVWLIEETFSTELRVMSDERGEFRAPAARFQFPFELTNRIVAVVGLDDSGRWFSHATSPPADPNFDDMRADPIDLQATYKTDQLTEKGEGQTIAILGTGIPPKPNGDVGRFITEFMLPTVVSEQYAQVFVGGPNRDDPEFAKTEYGENVLDAEMVFALAPKASVIHVHTATNSPGLFSDGIAFIVNNLPHAHAVSVSYGTCERYAPFEALTLGALFKQARAQGQTWFFASGDNGTDGCRDGHKNQILTVDWPASAADVFGVGGTEVDNGVEIAWAGSGGGQSELIPKPAYQVGLAPYADDGVRHVPDVAGLAGFPFVTVWFSDRSQGFGGTSAAAPMWAAIWSLLDQSQGGPGITNGLERIYQLGAMGQGFIDITDGSSGDGTALGFDALPGYDLATGWGSPDAKSLVDNW